MNSVRYLSRALRVARIALRQLGSLMWNHVRGRPTPDGPVRLRRAFEEMGGSFLKFGQILSLQIDILPRPYCDALLDLLDRVPPFSPAKVAEVFQSEFEKLPEKLFKRFDYRPFASASIGQVHLAELHDSTKIAVKVQRPEAEEVFHRDAVLLNLFVRVVFLFRIRSLYFLRDPVREYNEWIGDELDYRREARNAMVLERNSQGNLSEKVPRIYPDFTTRRVLTMDFLHGRSVLEYLRLRASGDQAKLDELARIGFDPERFVSNVVVNFITDALHFGVFHADLHPANLLILENNTVGYVDFGIIGTLSPEARSKVIQLTLAFVGGRTGEIYSSFLDISSLAPDADLIGFREELERLAEDWYRQPAIGGKAILESSVNQAMTDLLRLCRSYGLLPKREMIRYIRSVVLTDGLVSRLAPDLEYGSQLRRLCESYLLQDIRKKHLSSKTALPLLSEWLSWMQTGPGALLRAMERVSRGEFSSHKPARGEHREESRLQWRPFWPGAVLAAGLSVAFLNWDRFWDNPFAWPPLATLVVLMTGLVWLALHLLRTTRSQARRR